MTKALSPRFEELLLSVLIFEENALKRLGTLISPNLFSNSEFFLIASIVFRFYKSNDSIPTINVISDIVDGLNLPDNKLSLVKIALKKLSRPSESEVAYVFQKIESYIKKREIGSTIDKALILMQRGELDKVMELFRNTASYKLSRLDLGYVFFDKIKERLLDRRNKEESSRIPVLIPRLDDLLRGGLSRKELGVILGFSGRGKSMFMHNIAKAAIICGAKVIYYTFELSAEMVDERFAALFSKIETRKLLKNISNVVGEIEDAKMRYKGRLIIKEFPTRGANINDIRAHYSIVSERIWVPDLVMVDYGDIMQSLVTYGDKSDKEASNFEQLRKLAQEFNIPVWTATQVNRAGKYKLVADDEDVARAIEKVEISDVIISLNRTREEAEQGTMRLFVVKNRNYISKKEIKISTDFSRALIYDRL